MICRAVLPHPRRFAAAASRAHLSLSFDELRSIVRCLCVARPLLLMATRSLAARAGAMR